MLERVRLRDCQIRAILDKLLRADGGGTTVPTCRKLELRPERDLFPNLDNPLGLRIIQEPFHVQHEDWRQGVHLDLLCGIDCHTTLGDRCDLYGLGMGDES